MKHKVKANASRFITSLLYLLLLIIIGLSISLLMGFIERVFGDSILLSLLRLIQVCYILSLPALCFGIRGIYQEPTPYIQAIRSAYIWSIKEALKTEYPHGVVYILENILKELDKFELNWNPDSRFSNGDRYGFPNKTNLKETIKMARELSKDWEQLNALEPAKASQYMAAIRARIQQEDFYLWTNIEPKKGQDIYYFSYNEKDYQAEKQLENSSHQKYRSSNEEREQNHYQ